MAFGPNRDLLGVIPSDLGNVDVLLDRVQRGKDRPIWLFSSRKLAGSAPALWRSSNRDLGRTICSRAAPHAALVFHPALPVDRSTAGASSDSRIGLDSYPNSDGLPPSALAPPHPRTGRSQTGQLSSGRCAWRSWPFSSIGHPVTPLRSWCAGSGRMSPSLGCYRRHMAAHASRRCDH